MPVRITKRVAWAALLLGLALAGSGCGRNQRRVYQAAARMTGGDPHAGREKMRNYGCISCHTIPGVAGATALVGPPLTNIASRMIIAGELPNTPQNMTRWIQHPRSVLPHTVMPEMGVSDQDSRDIAAYLYTLH
jgi:cytochrome c